MEAREGGGAERGRRGVDMNVDAPGEYPKVRTRLGSESHQKR